MCNVLRGMRLPGVQVTFFAPELFVSLGMAQHTALIATLVIGAANHLAVYVSIWAADEFGRRVLLIEGGIQVTNILPRLRCGVGGCDITCVSLMSQWPSL